MLEKNTSYIELNKEALQFNVNFLKSEMGENVLISSVVKGNAYGHGIESYIPLAQECGLNHFCVYSAFEAKRVQKSLIKNATILIMGYMSEKHIIWAIKNKIEFFVSNLACLKT
ncbi:MAG TPA: alanine racemase, partial [Chitinophagaceae bacterium]|nr:alanine racemase [Chitinophagaceae bacterium]